MKDFFVPGQLLQFISDSDCLWATLDDAVRKGNMLVDNVTGPLLVLATAEAQDKRGEKHNFGLVLSSLKGVAGWKNFEYLERFT